MHWNIKDTPLKETTAHLIECLGVDAIDGAAVTIVLIRMISRPRSVLLVRVTPQEPKASENSTTHSFGRGSLEEEYAKVTSNKPFAINE